MNLYKMYRIYRRLMKNQWLDRAQINDLQAEKLRWIVQYAYRNVAYYKDLFDQTGVLPGDIQTVEDLKKIPITRKADLQGLEAEHFMSCKMHGKNLKAEHTSGSTGQPFTIYYDRNFMVLRNALFLRALHACGYKFGKKMLLITGEKENRSWFSIPGWQYASILQPPDTLLKILNRLKPDFLYGCKTPLNLMAEYIQKENVTVYHPRRVISTAEMLDLKTRRFLELTFNCEVYDLYGLTEMGIVGWECFEHNGYHIAEDTTVVEYQPVEGNHQFKKLVMTNLDLTSMPLIRFETGDVALPGQDRRCPCGRGFKKIERIEGRIADCIQLKNGRVLSPYQLTCALENLAGIKNYQVIQKRYDHFTVKVETGRSGIDTPESEICCAMYRVLGDEITLDIQKRDKLSIAAGTKFRVVESRVSPDIAHESVMH